MNDEIKEMNLSEMLFNRDEQLLDYITKLQEDVRTGQEINSELQQENERLKEQVNQYENPDDMTLFYMWLDVKAKDKIKELQQENERLLRLRNYYINENKDFDFINGQNNSNEPIYYMNKGAIEVLDYLLRIRGVFK